jgi:uridylate kinase
MDPPRGQESTMSDKALKYKRVILKLSGEAFGFGGKAGSGISIDETLQIARTLKKVVDTGVELLVVVGGGNILRGARFAAGGEIIQESTAHYMGMLATVLNGQALMSALESLGCEVRLQSAIRMDIIAEPYLPRRALRHLEKERVVILAGGTGNPFVTTDSAAALRGVELQADILMKATNVEGIYSEDPNINPHAAFYDKLTFERVIKGDLRVMDMQAISTCREGKLPILVFNFKTEGNIERAIAGHPIGTLVQESF